MASIAELVRYLRVFSWNHKHLHCLGLLESLESGASLFVIRVATYYTKVVSCPFSINKIETARIIA